MPSLEERIVASLVRLSQTVPDCARHMVVFPTSLMAGIRGLDRAVYGIVEEDQVFVVCYPARPLP